MSKYTNAKKVLPPKLYNELIKHFSGGTIYIPRDDVKEAAARKLVFELKKNEMNSREIAGMLGITRRRVNQILTEMRKKNV
jgi:hypothetical protein